MTTTRTRAGVAAFAASVCIGLSGCSAPPSKGGAGKSLTVKGSDTMVQLAQAWAEAFMRKFPGAKVSVTGGGSNTGIAALMNKGTDVCNASREMKESEREIARKNGVDVREFVVGRDALSVIVHPSNPVTELSLAQLKDLYTGKARNWKEVGGPDKPVVLNSRETSSGTYVFFQEQHQRAHLRFPKGFFKGDRLTDLISGEEHAVTPAAGGSLELRLPCPTWRFAMLVEKGA